MDAPVRQAWHLCPDKMNQYRPLSKRDVPDADLDTLHEDVEPWMAEPVIGWLRPFLWIESDFSVLANTSFLEGFEMAHRVRDKFDRTDAASPAADAEGRIRQGGTFGLDLVSYALHVLPTWYLDHHMVSTLEELLHNSGSAWEVTATGSEDDEERTYTLTRRDLAAAKAAISDIRSHSQRAGDFLADSWQAIARRDPRPGEGYDKAVKAIEAAAQPVVSPANNRATLGTIVRDMRAKPSKWEFDLGDVDLVIDMADRVWVEHFRHGTQPRTDHTLSEADVALHLAIPLVRFFVGGLVRLV
jgi:hypothetical protein